MEYEAEVTGIGVAIGEGTQQPVVLLEANEQRIPIFIGAGQVQSIAMARNGNPVPRPLTHDLLVDIVTDLGGAFDQVRIDDLEDGTFYAKLDIEVYSGTDIEKRVFDARPSDGIALAERVDCPVMVDESVVDAAGVDPDALDEQGIDRSTDRFRIDDDEPLE